MASKLKIIKDIKNREMAEVKFANLFLYDYSIPLKMKSFSKGKKKPVRNRCVLTGRARAVDSHFRLTRMIMKNLFSNGYCPGIVKASW